MLYKSTRGGDFGTTFEQALLSAYASDGGLFVPETLPTITTAELRSWAKLRLSEVCARVMTRFTDLPLSELEPIADSAFKTFNDGNEPPLPLDKVGDEYFLDTGLGPTLAFKDVGQQVVARLVDLYLRKRGEHANIIVETSGDTGPAAIAGVAGLKNCDIFVLYPYGRISPVQELQMITWGDTSNVHVYRTEGDTDEQAEALKLLFSNREFMATHKVVSINSINWARVMVQSTYYFWAYLQLRPLVDGPVHFAVPTGAFGNSVGGLVAKTMGLPIGKILCATNANDVVHRTITRGDLSIAPNVMTVSPAMDIQFAYNVERMLYLVSGGDTTVTAKYMMAAQQRKPIPLPMDLLKKVQQTFLSFAVTDEETCGTMASVYRESGLTLDPHSAVGVHAARLSHIKAVMRMGDAPSSEAAPICCVLTAHPAKFEDACAKAGVPVATCDKVERLKTIRHAFEWLRAPPKNVNKLEAWAAHIKRAVEEAAARRQQAAKPRSRL